MNTTLIISISICSIIVFGIIKWWLDIIGIRKTELRIEEFCDKAKELGDLIEKDKKLNPTLLEYIAANYKQVSSMIPERYPHMPVYNIGLKVRSAKWRDIPEEVYHIQIDSISAIAAHEDNRKKMLQQWWNPFNHFFRGISVLLEIVLGYPIKILWPDFNFNTKWWNILCSIVGLISGVITIGLFILGL